MPTRMCIQKKTAGLCAVTYAVLFSVDGGGACVLTVHEWAHTPAVSRLSVFISGWNKTWFIRNSPFQNHPPFLPPPTPSLYGENNPITFVSLDQMPGILCLYTVSHTHTLLWVPVAMALSTSVCSSWAWTPHLRKRSSVGELHTVSSQCLIQTCQKLGTSERLRPRDAV